MWTAEDLPDFVMDWPVGTIGLAEAEVAVRDLHRNDCLALGRRQDSGADRPYHQRASNLDGPETHCSSLMP